MYGVGLSTGPAVPTVKRKLPKKLLRSTNEDDFSDSFEVESDALPFTKARRMKNTVTWQRCSK